MLLSVRDLSVRKGRHTLLENVSFDVEPGLVLGLYGPSGAGKSITLLTICGLQDHAFTVTGQVWCAGREVSNLPTERRSMLGISIMLQGLWLFPDKTVVQNVAYPLKRRGLPSQAATGQAMQKLEEFHISNLASRYPDEISGGQQQRAALARAMVYEPKLLLLDEPFKGLEPELRDQLLAQVRDQSRSGMGVVMVTHDRRELHLAADAVVALHDGQVTGYEHRTLDEDDTPFASTRERVLVPDSPDSSAQLAVATSASLCDGSESILPGEGITPARVLELRTLVRGRVAVLLQYPSGLVGWIENSSHSLNGLAAGASVFVKYTLAKE